MVTRPIVTLREPAYEGSYVVTEQRADGSLVLEPTREHLSDVIRETDGRVFSEDEFVAHLERVAATVDDLPADGDASAR